MSGLLDSLSAATNALEAQRMGLDVAGQNLANINTDGYARRSLVLAEAPSTDAHSAGTGVTVQAIQAQRDQFVESRIQVERGGLQFDQSVSDALSVVQTSLGKPGSSLDATLSAFFNAFGSLATDPTSAANRASVVSQGQAVARGFADMAQRLIDARQSTDASIRGAIDQVNGLSAAVAKLNGQIGTGSGPGIDALIDQRTVDANKLADLIGAVVTQNSDGSVSLSAGNGQPLVIGSTSYALGLSTAPSTGLSTILSQGVDITSSITGGQIGGLLHVRDTLVPQYQSQLDQFAYDLATSVNTIHAAGYGSAGGTNQDFFTAPAAVAGAAIGVTLDSGVAADPSLVAASGTGAAGDNGAAQAIAALRNSPIGAGASTPSDRFAELVYSVGSDTADAQASQQTRQQIVNQLAQLRDSTSAVNSDEEAANLMKYQRAYEASARYFVTITQTLDALMAMVSAA